MTKMIERLAAEFREEAAKLETAYRGKKVPETVKPWDVWYQAALRLEQEGRWLTEEEAKKLDGKVEEKVEEKVEHPDYYLAGDLECKEVMKALGWYEHFALASALKYIWRHGKKGGASMDVEKAADYLLDLAAESSGRSRSPARVAELLRKRAEAPGPDGTVEVDVDWLLGLADLV